MSRREVIPLPFADPVPVDSSGALLFDWKCFKSSDLPYWDDLVLILVNEGDKVVTFTVYTCAIRPYADEPYGIAVPAKSQRSFRIDTLPHHHFIKLEASTDGADVSVVCFEATVRQSSD